VSFALSHILIHYKKLSSGQIYYFQAWMLHSCLSIVSCVCIAGLVLVIVQLFKNPPFRWCTKELLSISSSEIQILILTLVQVIFLLYITVYYWSITTSYFYLCTIHTVNCTFLKYKYKENRDPCFAPASMVIRPICTGQRAAQDNTVWFLHMNESSLPVQHAVINLYRIKFISS
jgi:hypothetical protein